MHVPSKNICAKPFGASKRVATVFELIALTLANDVNTGEITAATNQTLEWFYKNGGCLSCCRRTTCYRLCGSQ